MRKFLLLISMFYASLGFSQITPSHSITSVSRTNAMFDVVLDAGGTSGNGRAPQGSASFRYTRTCYIVTQAEMTAAGITSGTTINAIGFKYTTAQDVTTSGSFKVYLQNTSDAAYSKASTNWTNGTNGVIDPMTKAADIASVTIPAATGYWNIPFSGGSTFTYTGGALYIAWEYTNAAGTVATTANVAACNSALVGGSNGLRNIFSSSAAGTDLTNTSAFRPATRLGYALTNEASLNAIYTLGKLPKSIISSHAVSAVVTNNGDNTLTNLPVTLNITGANTYTNTQTIASIASGASTIVTFAAYSPTATGANTVTVSIPADNNNANNSQSLTQTVTATDLSYSDVGAATTSIGYNTGSGLLVTKYSLPRTVTIPTVKISISNTVSNTGNAIYGVVLDAAGAIIGQSPNYTLQAADNGAVVTLTLNTPVTISANTAFYVGIAQTANATTGYFPLNTQTESPGRAGTYYGAALAGGAVTEYTTLGRFMIEATTNLTFPVSLINFSGKKESANNFLSWSTATESNNKGFELERSADGKNFSTITFVATKADKGYSTTSLNYNYNDEKPFTGTNYYRLKQVDNDGKFTYSSVVVLKGDKVFDISALYPNPVKDQLNLSISSSRSEKATLTVTDLSGKVLKQLSVSLSEGDNNISINVSTLSTGSYLVRLINDKAEVKTTQFIKN